MICSICGGCVEWKGPLAHLTHTQCNQCGAVNSQEVWVRKDESDDSGDVDPANEREE
jgi:hypothetical protein